MRRCFACITFQDIQTKTLRSEGFCLVHFVLSKRLEALGWQRNNFSLASASNWRESHGQETAAQRFEEVQGKEETRFNGLMEAADSHERRQACQEQMGLVRTSAQFVR
ncbi:hypothetical protein A2853_00810 [Candidatus Kaiserbacteria bacterium RIFCSPHIGHO2_01_FULL_55_17]|uniref:Uncharacterized protein n=1 Tax=Candidatus Kaiserbacteria bacterium RIFCSPHIGHO2_01_FULL_55_17 TaxID=1798484 RepID=A0A1F6D9K4_9BACT|nr:MAG: hypothetical protein A2853_00810 [Candidatus Kaiserbacteria bacterium RIFCSPHIGHO2_01_FULL_55_17]